MTGISIKFILPTILAIMVACLGWVVVVNCWASRCLKRRKSSGEYSKDTGMIRKGLVARRRVNNKTLGLAVDKKKMNKF